MIPIASSIAIFITYLLLLVPIIVYIIIYLNYGNYNFIGLLFSLLSIFIFTTLISLAFSIFSSLSKDFQRTIPILTNSLFWLTPIVYSESLIFNLPPFVSNFLLNIYPVNVLFLNFRYCLLSSSNKINYCKPILSQLDNIFFMLALALLVNFLYKKLKFLIMENLV